MFEYTAPTIVYKVYSLFLQYQRIQTLLYCSIKRPSSTCTVDNNMQYSTYLSVCYWWNSRTRNSVSRLSSSSVAGFLAYSHGGPKLHIHLSSLIRVSKSQFSSSIYKSTYGFETWNEVASF